MLEAIMIPRAATHAIVGYRECRIYGMFHIEIFVKGHGLVFAEGKTREEAQKKINRIVKRTIQ